MPSRPAALRALETDTIDGHGQLAYEESSDPKREELRGRSMRTKMLPWRNRVEAERDASPKAHSRVKASGLRALRALRAPSERRPKPEPQPKIGRRPATARAEIERIKQKRAEAAEEAERKVALRAAELKAAELHTTELKEAERAAAAQVKAAKEAKALRIAHTLLVAEEKSLLSKRIKDPELPDKGGPDGDDEDAYKGEKGGWEERITEFLSGLWAFDKMTSPYPEHQALTDDWWSKKSEKGSSFKTWVSNIFERR